MAPPAFTYPFTLTFIHPGTNEAKAAQPTAKVDLIIKILKYEGLSMNIAKANDIITNTVN